MTSVTYQKHDWGSWISRGIVFALIWVALSGGATSSWLIGGPAVALALIASLSLIPPTAFAWLALLRFVPFFLFRSLVGGMDVARRAFHPRLPIAPGLFEYPMQLPTGLPQVFMANVISLLPGTLSAELENDILKLHVLDVQSDVAAELRAVEAYTADIFRVPPPPSE